MAIVENNRKPAITYGSNKKIHIQFSFSAPLALAFLCIAYAVWEIYWAQKMGYRFIKWHTHLAIWIYLGVGVLTLLGVANHFLRLRIYRKLKLQAMLLFSTLVIVEAVLFLTKTGATYTEKLNYGYFSAYSSDQETIHRRRSPNDSFYFDRVEFRHLRKTNSLGYSDKEWPTLKTKNEKRILCLGDSFTEGIGAEQDSTYPALLGALLRKNDSLFTIMNAGIASDDPVINFINYRDILLKYKPDLIIQSISTNDMNTDLVLRGGMERFLPDGTIKYHEAPWWEPIYAVSNIARLFFSLAGYNEILLRPKDVMQKEGEMANLIIGVLEQYAVLAEKNGCKLLIVLQPLSGEISQKRYEYNFAKNFTRLNGVPNLYVYDLLPFFCDNIYKGNAKVSDYYWQLDGHNNAKGYYLMAESVRNAIDSFQFFRTKTTASFY